MHGAAAARVRPPLPLDRLIDPRCGLVTEVRLERLGGVLHAAFADLADPAPYGMPLGNPTVAGASWESPEQARTRAVGEAVERYCASQIPRDGLTYGRWDALPPGGGEAVDPELFTLYRKEQLERPGFPFAGLRSGAEMHWAAGTDASGDPVRVPASLVWISPGPHAACDSRPALLPLAAGLAAGHGVADARRAALAEVVERHALATAWLTGAAFPELAVVAPVRVPGTALRWHTVPNRWAAPVVLCRAEAGDGTVAVGCALVPDAADPVAEAAAKSAAEALQSLHTVQLVAGGIPEWERPQGPLLPHRPDRRYAAAYAADLRDVTDLACHLQLLADPAEAARVRERLAAGAARGEWRGERLDLDRALAGDGLRVLTVDVTTADVRALTLTVVRVLVPGLRSTTPAAFPQLADGIDPLPPDPDLSPVPHA